MSFEKRNIVKQIINKNVYFKGFLLKKKHINYNNIINTLYENKFILSIEFLKQKKIYNKTEETDYKKLHNKYDVITKYNIDNIICINDFPNVLCNEIVIIKCNFNITVVFYKKDYYII